MSGERTPFPIVRTSIYACCAMRGDSNEHRAALLLDVREEKQQDYAWWRWYFDYQAKHQALPKYNKGEGNE